MTIKIKVYPSMLPGEPIEVHEVSGGTLGEWLSDHCKSYKESDVQPVCAIRGGEIVPPLEWGNLECDEDIEIRPLAQGGVFKAAFGLLGNAFKPIFKFLGLFPSTPKGMANQSQNNNILEASLNANNPKLNGIIPEIAGRHKIYPDYLCQPRRYFTSPTTQALDAMMCIGVGEFQINAQDIRIGETRIGDLTNVATYEIFQPGQDVSGNQSHRNWYNAPEVGNTSSTAGLRLKAGTSGTPFIESTSYVVDSNSIGIPPGAGLAPQDWEAGNIVSIIAPIRTIEIVDGGGTWTGRNRDKVRGDFSDLNLSIGDQVQIYGVDDARYRVVTYTNTGFTAGSPSTITSVRIPSLDFAVDPIDMVINGYNVRLDQGYPDFDDLVADINAQALGVTASMLPGYFLRITENAPYSGEPIKLSGYYDLVFGAAPDRATGTKTESFDEMTLDKWTPTTSSSGAVTYSWQPASSMTPGIHNNVDVQKPRVRGSQYSPTEYRITSLITGTILDPSGNPTTGTVGFNFERLNPDGSTDTGWTGFAVSGEFSGLTIRLDSSAVVGGWLGPFKATPRNEQSSKIEFDVFAPEGVGYVKDDGAVERRTKTVEIQWRSGSGPWTSQTFSFDAASRDQLGYTREINLPSSLSDVEVRLRRVGSENEDIKQLDRLEWYGLRSLLPSATSYAGVTTMAVTISGSDAIASNTENQVNLIVTRKLNGSSTRSIVDWARYVCADIGYPSSSIDESEFTRLKSLWNSRGDYFDATYNDQTTVKDAINDALRAGYAELTIDEGRIRPVRDEPRSMFEHVYTPQNMLEGGLTRQFTSYDPDDYDGVDVEYLDSSNWIQQTVQCRLPGDAGLRVRKVSLQGVTDRAKVWRWGMRQRRIMAYRRKQYNFETEFDALNSSYMSYCALTDDVPGYARSSFIVSKVGDVITSSEPIEFSGAGPFVAAFRRPDGTLSGPYPISILSEFEVQVQGAMDFNVITSGSLEPTHMIIGELQRWSYPALITSISPSGDSVSVEAVNYDERVYADDNNYPDN